MTRLSAFVVPVVLVAMLGCSEGPPEATDAGAAGGQVATPAPPEPNTPAATPEPAASTDGPVQDALSDRPTEVTAIMSTSRGTYDGTFTLSQKSRACGEVTQEMVASFKYIFRAFVVQFPILDGGDYEVSELSFDSKDLIGGVTTTRNFSLSLSLKSKQIGRPAGYVLDTSRPQNTGTATLTTPSPGTVRLKVDGVNDRGQTVNLTVACGPRQG